MLHVASAAQLIFCNLKYVFALKSEYLELSVHSSAVKQFRNLSETFKRNALSG